MEVTKRLQAISLFIDDYANVVDIGCDHGLLDIYLTLNKHCICTAIDVNNDIISRAYNNFLKYNLTDKINLLVENGFNDLKVNQESVIVLAGMGTSTILKILDKNRSNTIICQTNTDLCNLRKKVCDMGYYISDESIVFDNNRYYVTIKFSKGNRLYSYDQYLLGPILLKENSLIFKDYIKNLYEKLFSGYKKSLEYGSCSNFDDIIKTIEKYI